MPTISLFFGITIRMYFGDHPPPHVHAAYQGFEALIDIETRAISDGRLPRRVHRLVTEWIEINEAAILENGQRAQALEPLERIPGLDND